MADPPPSDNVFVSGLPPSITEEAVRKVFATYGQVSQCRVLTSAAGKVSALVRFQTTEQATWMVQNVSGNVPAGLKDAIIVRYADSPEMKANRAQAKDGGRADIIAGGVIRPASNDIPPSDKVFVSGLPPDADSDRIKSIFEAYGRVQSCKLVGDKTSAVLKFATEEEAIRVVRGLNGVVPNGLRSPVTLQFADTPETQAARQGLMSLIVNGFVQSGVLPGGRKCNSEHAIYVAGLPFDTEDVHLYRLFACFGPIAPRGVRAMMNTDGSCKGIAFVNFLTPEAVTAAITTFNGAILPDGSTLKVSEKNKKGLAPGPYDRP